MPLYLSKRDESLMEQMDRPDCDRELLNNTYRQFGRINRLLSGWDQLYKSILRPVFRNNNSTTSLLDIGCGGGDILYLLHRLCLKDGFHVTFTGIDPDPRSLEFTNRRVWPDRFNFQCKTASELAGENRTFDIVISNHLMHHLAADEIYEICGVAESLSRRLVLFSDIERSDLGFLSFSLIAPLLFRNSYIVPDGRISIRKSFRKNELQSHVPDGWKVKRQFPFRLLATYQPGHS